MKRLSLAIAVGAAALLGVSAANASDNTVPTKAAPGVTKQSTDISSRGRHHKYHGHRHHRHHGHRHHHHHRHYGFRHYRPYYGGSYGYYAPRPYYRGYGGPGITFSFGSGGYW